MKLDYCQAPESAEEYASKHPHSGQRHADVQRSEEIEAPVGPGHHSKPGPYEPGGEGWMLGISQLEFLAPRPCLGHVMMQRTPAEGNSPQRREHTKVEE